MSGQARTDAHAVVAAHDPLSETSASGQASLDAPTRSVDADVSLLIAADLLDDLEQLRMRTENRLRSLTHPTVEGERGGWFGKALPPDMPEVKLVEAILDGIRPLERQATRAVEKAMRSHPLGPWVESTHGIGLKTIGRLLATIGDPCERRTVSQLWSYCGYAPGQKRQKGVKANWNAKAKTRAYLVVERVVTKPDSPYEQVYRRRRAHTAETRPDWTPGHSHNDALRVAAKAVLRDLWIEARRTTATTAPIDETSGGPHPVDRSQGIPDTHWRSAAVDTSDDEETAA